MKHPFVLVFLTLNALFILLAARVGRDKGGAGNMDDRIGSALGSIAILVALVLLDGAGLIYWLVKG